MERTKRAWQRMLSGRRLDLLNPSPLDIEIEDIAHGLSFLSRWNGQTKGNSGFSVAEHSLLVEKIFSNLNPGIETKWRMAALLHDAAEYVIGDLISPVKSSFGNEYAVLEERLLNAIYLRYSVPCSIPDFIRKKIKLADKISARAEAVQIAGFSKSESLTLFGNSKLKEFENIIISPKPPLEAKALFLNRHAMILDKM